MVSKDDLIFITRTILSELKMWSYDAEELILRTGAAESHYKYLRQISGPARSFWQVESATCLDNISNYLIYRPDKLDLVAKISQTSSDIITELDDNSATKMLTHNIAFAICNARIKYWRIPKKIPNRHDIEAQGEYYIKYYNAGGKATMKKWKDAVDLIGLINH